MDLRLPSLLRCSQASCWNCLGKYFTLSQAKMRTGYLNFPFFQGQQHQVPFGGFKQSGIGCEMGEYALAKYVDFSRHLITTVDPRLLIVCLVFFFYRVFSYTNVKSVLVHINLGYRMWRIKNMFYFCLPPPPLVSVFTS